MLTSNTNERKWQQPQFQSHYQTSWHLRICLAQYGLLWWLSLDNEDVFINPNFLWMAHSLNSSSFLYYGTFLSVWCTFPPCFTKWLWHCQSCTSYSGASYLGIFFKFESNFRGFTLYPEAPCRADITKMWVIKQYYIQTLSTNLINTVEFDPFQTSLSLSSLQQCHVGLHSKVPAQHFHKEFSTITDWRLQLRVWKCDEKEILKLT